MLILCKKSRGVGSGYLEDRPTLKLVNPLVEIFNTLGPDRGLRAGLATLATLAKCPWTAWSLENFDVPAPIAEE